ncbi:MAG: chromosome partitioning protein ParB [Salinisphaera sp.]|nr:chromosome partitioning protein ParB [Salinisphaera sp.]MDN5938585.1 chromosome partitioning protein ParB [Salinisphaera sp.]
MSNLSVNRPSAGGNAPTLREVAKDQPTVRVTFNLDAELHRRLRVYAAQERATVRELLQEQVRALLTDAGA